MRRLLALVALLTLLAFEVPPWARYYYPHIVAPEATPDMSLTFAVIGDQGLDSPAQRSVATLIAQWAPEFIVTTGDNYYGPAGGTGMGRYDKVAGGYYCRWLKGAASGPHCPSGGDAARNNFYPVVGNHDYSDSGLQLYEQYFDLPDDRQGSSSSNERYYDFVRGPVHFFMLNSNQVEPDSTDVNGKQARWLREGLARSTTPWQIVAMHHAPYSSGSAHGSAQWMQWPFAEWGADAVLAGHDHTYERVMVGKTPYFVNGLGGGERYDFGKPVAGSTVRFNADWGAQRVTATRASLTFEFVRLNGEVIDRLVLTGARVPPAGPG